MSNIENPKSFPIEGEHPVFGSVAAGCRFFDAGPAASLYELGDQTNHGRFKVSAKNGSLVLLELICNYCKEHVGFAPNHSGSQYCKSGSLASGGKYAHCTCDTCF